MLIEFSVENFLSFKEKATFSMVASSDKSLPYNIIKSAQGTDIDLLRSAAVYGANASGKSNFIEALKTMDWFVTNSSKEGQKGSNLPVTPFKLEVPYDSKPSTFEIKFLFEGVPYDYGFTADSKRVYKEWFFSYPKGQRRKLFNRVQSKLNKIDFGRPYWKGPGKSLVPQTRDNALFISVAAQFNNKLAEIVTDWFSGDLKWISKDPTKGSELSFTSEGAYSDSEMKDTVLKFLKHADLGISDFKVHRKLLEESDIHDDIKEKLKKEFPGDAKPYSNEIYTVHRGVGPKGNPIDVVFKFDEESDGTKKFFSLAGPIAHVLQNCFTLVVDELDVKEHPRLTRWIIELFHNKTTNPDGAQLIFTTHDATLLDQSLFRRDQIWFTEKDEKGASSLFSLWDFSERKDVDIRKRYMAGRYGAIPDLDHIVD